MKRTLFVSIIVLCVCAGAEAQDAGQVGVSLGYPAAVGIIWHVTDSVAVRPDISFSHGSTDNGALSTDLVGVSAASGESSSTSLTAGVSGLLYLGTWDKLRAYVSPRYAYGRLTSNSGSTFASDATNATHIVIGSFGAHYQLHRRFAVFGEAGYGYSHSRTTLTSVVLQIPGLPNIPAPVSRFADIVSHRWGTSSGVGVIFYFK